MIIAGRVIDKDSGDPVAGATVELWTGSIMLNRGAANDIGFFSLSTTATPDKVTVTSASYNSGNFGITDYVNAGTYQLQKNIVEGDPVIIVSIIKKNAGLIGLGLIFLFLLLKKK